MRKDLCAKVLVPLSMLSSCSVYNAASNEGIAVADIQGCTMKGCLLSHGMDIIDQKDGPDGSHVEMYRAIARKTGLNYVRAAGHGVLDVATLGLWEVAGTPIEGAISNNRGYITARVVYPNKNSDQIQSFEIYDGDGAKVTIM